MNRRDRGLLTAWHHLRLLFVAGAEGVYGLFYLGSEPF